MTQILSPRPVSQSAVHEQVYRVFPNDLNSNGTVFGGLVMSMLDRITSVVAERHSGRLCVTASVDSMHFLAPALGGDILIFMASVNRAWRSSMEIGAKVMAENFKTSDRKHIVSAYFTFVALDEDQRPVEVPAVVPETAAQKRRYEEAQRRRENRKTESEERKVRRGGKT